MGPNHPPPRGGRVTVSKRLSMWNSTHGIVIWNSIMEYSQHGIANVYSMFLVLFHSNSFAVSSFNYSGCFFSDAGGRMHDSYTDADVE